MIRGRVFDADTGHPLPRVRVSLVCSEARLSRAVPSDLEGRYEFRWLPACRYRLSFSKSSYVRLEYGQRRPFQAGKAVLLAEGQALEKLDIALPRGGVITGRVTDDLGDPATGILVLLMRRTITNGTLSLVPSGLPSETDDLGRFRFAGLSSGTYFVGTTSYVGGQVAVDEGPAPLQTFFPGSADAAFAEPVPLRAGEERHDVDFTLAAGRPISLTGTVVDASGRPVTMATISLVQSVGGLTSSRTVGTEADGKFRIPGVAPGDYTLAARARDANSGEDRFAYTRVTSAGADLDGILLVLKPGICLRGRVQLDNGVTATFSPAALSVHVGGPGTSASGRVRSDWTFEIGNVWPGPTAVTLKNLPVGWAVKSMSVGGHEALDDQLEVKPDEGSPAVVMTITNRPPVLFGTVIDDSGAIAKDCTVVVFSEDRARWGTSTRSIATATPDQNGDFEVAGLAQGWYLAVALEYLDQGDEHDPRLLEQWRARAARVELVEGKRVRLDLKLAQTGR